MASARNARKALARGAPDEALVLLWNEVEAARVAGDTGTLRDIGRLAEGIQRIGDPAQQREAGRLLETLARAGEHAAAPAATTETLDAHVARNGGPLDLDGVTEPTAEEAEEGGRGIGKLTSLVWIVLFLLIVIANALRGIGGE